MKRPYFFGYLFVKARTELALLVMSIGIGYCVLEYSQAKASASATGYQPSAPLARALAGLTDSFSSTQSVVSAFDTEHNLTMPNVQPPRFPTVIAVNDDFAAVDEALTNVDRQRELLKQSVISRFDTLVGGIETKLRAYAAGVKGAGQPTGTVVVTTATATATATATPAPAAVQPKTEGSVFSTKLNLADMTKRNSDLNAQMEYLEVLKSKAENPQNRANLTDAVSQLEALSKLLPEKSEPESPASGPNDNDLSSKLLPSERVAMQLQQLRGQVRQIFLTSWKLDESFQEANDLASAERDKCRVATLAQKGIWLSTISRILVGLLAAVLACFVILVCADLVKTFLDTASHTGVVADAINAMRGATIIAKNQVRQDWPARGSDISSGNGNP